MKIAGICLVGCGIGSATAWLEFPLGFATAQQFAPIARPAQTDDEKEGEEDADVDGVFLPPDHATKEHLKDAAQWIKNRQFSDSAKLLGSILDSPEDYFFKPDPRQTSFDSLKGQAERLIGQMPPEGRDSYELQFGAQARRMLNEAAAAGDISGITEVSRRYFYTRAGAVATWIVGLHNLDHDRTVAAALCFQRLSEAPITGERFQPEVSLALAICWARSGSAAKAKQTLAGLRKSHPGAEVRIAGKTVKLFQDEAQSLAWLNEKVRIQHHASAEGGENWTLFRGDPERNEASHGSRPLLNPRWKVRTPEDPGTERKVRQLRQAYLDQEVPVLPSLHPLAVGNVVLMRTSRNLLAVDFESGKRVWEAKSGTESPVDPNVLVGRINQFGQTSPAFNSIDQRMWDDATFGTLSSDGEQVFVIDDLPRSVDPAKQLQMWMPNGQKRPSSSRNANRMSALMLRTEGKLNWEIGGPYGSEPKLAGAYFLGPPLPLQGKLYALAEMKQEIRLLVLSAKTGQLEWSQQLAVVDREIVEDPVRRAAGGSPSYADGILICPTSNGAVVAVDLTTRLLRWGFQYPRTVEAGLERAAMFRVGRTYSDVDHLSTERWADSTATISGGRVLLTPVEGNHLYCLNLVDGQLAWKLERGGNRYLACVHDDKVVLVGAKEVTACKLSDGETIWTQSLPAGSIPSGLGFYSAGRYYLPLSSSEVAQIDLADGKIEARAKSRRPGAPGNLICFRGEVISQSPEYLETFYQLDSLKEQVAETLKARPNDAKALAGLGEIRIDEGRLHEAVDLFRRSYEIEPDDYTRELLVSSLLEAMRGDFAGNRALAQELEGLVQSDAQRTAFLRLSAAGLQQAGETAAAFGMYLKLADQDGADLDEVNDLLSVRRSAWVRAHLTELYKTAKDADKQQLDQAIAGRLKTVLESDSAKSLQGFLAVFGSHPLADEARRQLISQLKGPETLLQREQLLRQLEQSAVDAHARSAAVQLARLFEESQRPELAAIAYRKLVERWPDAICVDGKTGKQLLAGLDPNSATAKRLNAKPWPVGEVKVAEGGSKLLGDARRQRSFDLTVAGPTGAYFDGVTVSLDSQQQSIQGQDELGNERFRVALVDHGGRRNFAFNNFTGYSIPILNYVRVDGNLMLVWMGHQIIAVDTLRGREASGNRVLWTQDLNDQMSAGNQGVHHRNASAPWGQLRYLAQDSGGRPLGMLGPIGSAGVCFQRFRDLVCVSPLTGQVLWTRRNVPAGSELFGDGELLIAAPPEGGEALVLRAADGELLGKRQVPKLEERMGTVGRCILSWQPKDGGNAVTLRDVWSDEDKWTETFSPGAKACMVGQEALGVFEPNGRFVLLGLPGGNVIARHKLDPTPALTGIYLLRSSDQYLLVTNMTPRGSEGAVTYQAAPGGMNDFLINGWMYALDSTTGKLQWPASVPIRQQGLLLGQPSELPVITFARHTQRTSNNNQVTSVITAVLCIDKRNGRKIYENDRAVGSSIANFEMQGDRADGTVALMLPGKTVTMTFTDQELKPAAVVPADVEPPEKPVSRSGKSIFKALGKPVREADEPEKAAPEKPGPSPDPETDEN